MESPTNPSGPNGSGIPVSRDIDPAQQRRLDEKARRMLEEKEAESRLRTYHGPMRKVLTVLLCFWALFQLYFTTVGVISADEFDSVVNQLLPIHGKAVLSAYAKEATDALGPLRLIVKVEKMQEGAETP